MLTKERGTPEPAPRYTSDRLSTGIQEMPTCITIQNEAGVTYFRPGGRDPLFWCFQVVRGIANDVETREERSFQREQTLKADAVSKLRLVTDARTDSARRKLAEAEGELCARQFTRGHGLEALARAYGLSILYVSGRTCCGMGPVPDADGFAAIIRRVGSRNSRRHEVLTGEQVPEEVTRMLNSTWRMESWTKPLRGISSYSLVELRSMAEAAGLQTTDAAGKKLKKADLYAALGALSKQN